MSDRKKTKSAVEACREVSKAMRANLDALKKTENESFSPKDAALRVLPAVVAQIKAYEEQLVKMRQLEVNEPLTKAATPLFTAPPKPKPAAAGLGHVSQDHGAVNTSAATVARPPKLTKKTEPALATESPASDREMDHKFKLSKVFEVLGKTSIMEANRKQFGTKKSDKVEDAFRHKDSLLPTDAAPKEIDTPDGDVKKGKKMIKGESPLNKKWTLGGKSSASKMATSHAMHAGSTAMNAKINKMPANQLPKMPSAPAQAARHTELSSFTPKGKFDKSAESMNKAVTPTHTANAAQSGTSTPPPLPSPVQMSAGKAPRGGSMKGAAASSGFSPLGNAAASKPYKPQKAAGDPSFDNSYNVNFQAQHGTYTTRGGFGAAGSPNIELHYKANKGKIPGLPASSQKLGEFPTKEHAYAARDQHHDAKAAGLIKDEEAMNKAFDAKGKFIPPHLDPKKKLAIPGKK